jgi:hypothetical protein
MRRHLNPAAFAIAVALIASTARAGFLEPGDWSASDPQATAQVWDFFTSQTGNAPDTLDLNANGTATAGDANFPASGSFVTGGGNIYAIFGEVFPSAEVPHFGTTGGDFTTVLVQLETLGSPIDPGTIALSDGTETFAPDDVVLTERTDLGDGPQFGGSIDTWWIQFNLTGSADMYDFVVEPTAASLSFDGLRIDTFTSTTPTFVTPPPAVPEPASIALLAGAGLMLLRRRG